MNDIDKDHVAHCIEKIKANVAQYTKSVEDTKDKPHLRVNHQYALSRLETYTEILNELEEFLAGTRPWSQVSGLAKQECWDMPDWGTRGT